jgi:hypothetical protein
MARGEQQQLEQQEAQAEVPAADEAVVIPPAVVPQTAVPTGAHMPDTPGGLREVLALSSPKERRKFVLQMQRTAGNAAVCRWLGVARARYVARMDRGDDDPEIAAALGALDELEALVAGGDEPPNEAGPRAR